MIPSLVIAAMLALGQAETGPQVDDTRPQATAAQATPQDAASQAGPASASSDDGEKIICRKERRTGTNMTARVCRSASQRRQDADAARDALHNGQSINNLDTGAR